MYSKLPNLVLGFHGCDQKIFNHVLREHNQMEPSSNSYDWLGTGIYFWEQSYARALDWARNHRNIKSPAVIGAVIDLGHCLNLTDYQSTEVLKQGYNLLKAHCDLTGTEIPQNKNITGNSDLLLRRLDCAVVNQIHQYNRSNHKPEFDSVRGIFIEGNPIYPNSGFREKTHVQLCIVNPNCIKGFFNPIKPNDEYPIP